MLTLAKSEHHLRDVCKCTTIYSTQIFASHCLIEIFKHICPLFLPSLCLPMPTMAYILQASYGHFASLLEATCCQWLSSYMSSQLFMCPYVICMLFWFASLLAQLSHYCELNSYMIWTRGMQLLRFWDADMGLRPANWHGDWLLYGLSRPSNQDHNLQPSSIQKNWPWPRFRSIIQSLLANNPKACMQARLNCKDLLIDSIPCNCWTAAGLRWRTSAYGVVCELYKKSKGSGFLAFAQNADWG